MTPAHPKPAPRLELKGRALADRNTAIDSREQQRCARCGAAIWANASRHHRKYKSRRGGDEISNGVLLCGSGTTGCHGWAHHNPEEARATGFAVLSSEDPRTVRIQHALYGWVWLNNDGGVSLLPPA